LSSAGCKELTIRLFPRGDGGAGSDPGVVLEELPGGGRNTPVLTGERGSLCLAASVDFFVCPHTSSRDIAVFRFSRRRCLAFLKLLTGTHSVFCLQCFDTVGWEEHLAWKKLSNEVLVWLPACSEVPLIHVLYFTLCPMGGSVAEWLACWTQQSHRCRVTLLGKLFTPIVPLFTKLRNW